MRLATTKFINSTDGLERMLVNKIVEADALKDMSAENLTVLQACLRLVDAYKEMLDAEAEQMWRIEHKLDEVLLKLKKIES